MGVDETGTVDDVNQFPVDYGDSSENQEGDSPSTDRKRVLGMLPVISIIFFSVAGGPYGTEHLILKAGPLFSVLTLSLVPWVWGFPIGLLTAELASAFPSNGGYTTWVKMAFGDFWGVSEGMWSWYSGVCDNAIYPVLMVDYLILGTGMELSSGVQWFLKATISTLLTCVNLLGLEVVGTASVVVNFLVMAPFCFLLLGGLDKMNPANWDDTPRIHVVPLLHTVLWNYNGFDQISTLAGEVIDPGKTIPRAIFYSTGIVMATYILPVLIATSLDAHYGNYNNGYYGVIAGHTLGPAFHAVFFASASTSGVGMYIAEMAGDTYNLSMMGEEGLIPRVFGKRWKRSGTPWVATLTQYSLVMCLISLPFESILQVDNFLYCASILLEVGALIQLRQSHAHVLRPYKIPVDGVWLLVLFVPTLLLALYAMFICDWQTWMLGGCLVAATTIGHIIHIRCKKNGRITL